MNYIQENLNAIVGKQNKRTHTNLALSYFLFCLHITIYYIIYYDHGILGSSLVKLNEDNLDVAPSQ